MPSKSKTASKSKAAAAPATPVAAPAPAAEPASPLAESFAAVIAAIAEQRTAVSALNRQVRELEKQVRAEMKRVQKKRPRAKRDPSKAGKPNGFEKEQPISDELAEFFGLESGAEMSRKAVAANLLAYIKDNGLQQESDGRQFKTDKALAKLFTNGDIKTKKGEVLSLFGYQKRWNHHILKASE
jgi:chromatin remodeling complex protein RSC6